MSEPTPALERTIEALLFLSPEPISAAELTIRFSSHPSHTQIGTGVPQ